MVGCMVSLQLVSSEGVESTAQYSAHCGPVKALVQALVKPEQKSVLGGEHLSNDQ